MTMPIILKSVISSFICLSIVSCNINKELNQCSVYDYKHSFALEVSTELWSVDDMILRKPAFFLLDNEKIRYGDGIFLFEQMCLDNDDCPLLFSSEDVMYFNNNLNDSVHSQLIGLDAKYFFENSGMFKSFDLNIKALYLGKKKNLIYKNGKYKVRNLKTYLIIDFQEIRAL